MNLLLSGFEPFGEDKINPSERVVRELELERISEVDLHVIILPVDTVRAPVVLIDTVQRIQPEAVMCLGQATRRMAISIERVAINLRDFRIADNAGEKVTDAPIIPGGPAAYFCTLPVRAIFDAVRAAGVPAELSFSAGSYLCNQVTYQLLHHLTGNNSSIPAGFVHLPTLPEQVIGRPALIPSMALETMNRGICAAIGALGANLKSATG